MGLVLLLKTINRICLFVSAACVMPLVHKNRILLHHTFFFFFFFQYLLLFYTEVSAPSSTVQLPPQKPMEVPVAMNNPLPFPSSMLAPIGRPTAVPHDTDEDEGLKHFEQVS